MPVAANTTLGLVAYYANLLVRQYITKPKAVATIETSVTPIIMPQTSVQTITFPAVPTGGSFVITYGDNTSGVTINWNDSAAVIQAKLRGLPPGVLSGGNADTIFSDIISGGNASTVAFQDILGGGSAYGFDLSGIVVTGSIASGTLTVTFDGVTPPAALLAVLSSALVPSMVPVITEIDMTCPLAVQAGYQIMGSDTAVGVQLDVIGKYAGVTRTGNGFTTQITLDDSDFLQLIKMAIARNNAGSDLATIQQLMYQLFGGQIIVIDYADMNMSFLISEAVGSQDLVQLFITEGLLPVPMAVGYSVIYAPIITDFFGFVTYEQPSGWHNRGFNTYQSYNETWPFLVYQDEVIP